MQDRPVGQKATRSQTLEADKVDRNERGKQLYDPTPERPQESNRLAWECWPETRKRLLALATSLAELRNEETDEQTANDIRFAVHGCDQAMRRRSLA